MGMAGAVTVFDSTEKATEIKLAPAIQPSAAVSVQKNTASNAQNIKNVSSTSTRTLSLKEQKFNSALVNLDDAQVELRQELAATSAKYTEAVNEKNRAVQNVKALKKEVRSINKKMKNVEKSKQMINKNLEAAD